MSQVRYILTPLPSTINTPYLSGSFGGISLSIHHTHIYTHSATLHYLAGAEPSHPFYPAQHTIPVRAPPHSVLSIAPPPSPLSPRRKSETDSVFIAKHGVVGLCRLCFSNPSSFPFLVEEKCAGTDSHFDHANDTARHARIHGFPIMAHVA